MRVVLIGFMASGKTTLGKVLANELAIDFYDLDDLIAERSGCTIRQIFDRKGEEGFREIEQASLEEILKKDNMLLSTGGGAPCHKKNMNKLLRKSFVIYLETSIETLVDRMMDSRIERPLVSGKSQKELREYVGRKLQEREPVYQKAHYTINSENIDIESLIKIIKERSEKG